MLKRNVKVRIAGDQINAVATCFIKTANEFSSQISVRQGGNRVNAKSLLGFLSLEIKAGSEIELTAEGADADAAVEALAQILE